MNDRWPTRELNDLVDPGRKIAYGVLKPGDEDPGGVPLVRAMDIKDGRVLSRQLRTISLDLSSQYRRTILQGGELLMSLVGTPGEVALAPDLLAGANVNRATGVIPLDDSVCHKYVMYYFRSPEGRNQIVSRQTGSVQVVVNLGDLRTVRIPLPPLPQQHAIADILGSIDDLIENNRRRVEVLEEMARAIYREWFVHFRYPGHEHDTLVDSPLGPVPGGWEVRSVGEISEVVTRGIAPKYADNGQWLVVNQKCIRDGRISLERARRQERSVTAAKRAQFGDVLINSTGVGTLGRAAVLLEEHPALTVDSHVTIVRPADPAMNPWFGMGLASRQPEFEALATGSTGQTELSRKDVGALQVPVPPRSLWSSFADTSWPLLTPVPALLDRNRSLASIRDLLLPKLVTGQIDVSSLDLDALVEGAGA